MLETYSGATRLVPVVGDPIAQVKSPFGMTAAFEARGADTICVPMQVAAADFVNFMALMRVMKNVDGLIVTIPNKFSAFDACDSVSERARFLRSVNTIRRGADGAFHGDMFDGLGFVEACKAKGCTFEKKRALLIGAGGAGTAIAHAVVSAGTSVLAIAETNIARRDDLIGRLNQAGFTVEASDRMPPINPAEFDIVLNATPMGMQADDALPVDPEHLTPAMFVGDVVTRPEVTPLIAAARARGNKTSTGVDMFEKVRDLMVTFLLDRP